MSVTSECRGMTKRELEILELVASGKSAKEVAQICEIAPRTVECHLDTMRLKLRARNRTHMVAIAIAADIISKAKFRLETPLAARASESIGFT